MGVKSQVSRCLDRLVAPLFRMSNSGRVLFFPFGALGRGRVVPDWATSAQLRTGARHAWLAFFCVLLPLLAVFMTLTPNIWVLLVMLFLALLEYLAFMATLIKGLEISGHRMLDCDGSAEPPAVQQLPQDI